MTVFKCGSCQRSFQTQYYRPDHDYSCPTCRVALLLVGSPAAKPDAPEGAPPKEVLRIPASSPLLFGRFLLESELGRGAMGIVHKCWDTKLKRWVAIKVLLLGAADTEGLERFRQEASVVASMDHPNIAPVYDVLEEAGRFAYVMKYIDGKTLKELFSDEPPKPAPCEQVLRYIRDAALGLGYAHARGFVHRDLKPANIMVDREGRVYVLDFGFAKVLARTAAMTQFGRILGTPAFMSPEQAMGLARDVDARSDVFSLGSTLWTLLAGHRPFQGKSDFEIAKAILKNPTPSIRVPRPDISEELDLVLKKALEKDRDRRHPSAVELASDLNECLVNSEQESESKRKLEPIRAPHDSNTVLVIDDDSSVVKLIRDVLGREGLKVVSYADGAKAMEYAGEHQPGIVLLDVTLPGMSGWEILERLRRIPSYESVPILMVTGECGEENAVRGFQLGADDYIEKPFSIEVLKARVRRHLLRHHLA